MKKFQRIYVEFGEGFLKLLRFKSDTSVRFLSVLKGSPGTKLRTNDVLIQNTS